MRPSSEQTDVIELENQEQDEEELQTVVNRKPRGQEVRTAHGKLEVKLTPNDGEQSAEVDVLQYETEVSISRAKGMFQRLPTRCFGLERIST